MRRLFEMMTEALILYVIKFCDSLQRAVVTKW